MNETSNKIEAILFYSGEPVAKSVLQRIFEIGTHEFDVAISELQNNLQGRGVSILEHDDKLSLVTSPKYSDLIEKIAKEERERDLGRAGIETLTIIAYKGPISRKEIDYIRGVNSQFALRNLMLRGLVERKNSEQDERVMVYNITADTLRFLGLSKIDDLPEYNKINTGMDVKDVDENNDLE